MTSGTGKDSVLDLGEGILFYDGADTEVLNVLVGRTRFLDKLWLPCRINELSHAQLKVINRFRERVFSQDQQFQHAQKSREAFLHVLRDISDRNVIEIGCGKFPLVSEHPILRYSAFDLDEDAIDGLSNKGISCYHIDQWNPSAHPNNSIVVAVHTFHFYVPVEVVKKIAEVTSDDGVLVFNIIVDSEMVFANKISALTRYLNIIRVLKTEKMSKRELFVVLGPKKIEPTTAVNVSFALERYFKFDS